VKAITADKSTRKESGGNGGRKKEKESQQ